MYFSANPPSASLAEGTLTVLPVLQPNGMQSLHVLCSTLLHGPIIYTQNKLLLHLIIYIMIMLLW